MLSFFVFKVVLFKKLEFFKWGTSFLQPCRQAAEQGQASEQIDRGGYIYMHVRQ